MIDKFARFISIIGHPLLTIPVFVLIVMYAFEDVVTATKISFLIIGCFFVPVILRLLIKSKNGSYTNFDVSDRQQRKSLYTFSIPILAIVTAVLFATNQSLGTSLSVLFALILLVISMCVNLFVKSSLHVSLHIFLAALVYSISREIAIVLLLFTALLCWSRLRLGRHTLTEILAGIVVGSSVGVALILCRAYYRL